MSLSARVSPCAKPSLVTRTELKCQINGVPKKTRPVKWGRGFITEIFYKQIVLETVADTEIQRVGDQARFKSPAAVQINGVL